MRDTFKNKGQRQNLIDGIRRKGIKDERILKVMMSIPRHFFLDTAFQDWAYQDKAFPIGKEQTISQPYTVAFQTELLEIKKRDKILEIGTGSGYQAAVLFALGARVFTVERHQLLRDRASELLQKLGFGLIRCFHRDGFKGLAEFAPFDKILFTAGAKKVPQKLKDQLKVGGYIVVPEGAGKTQTMKRYTKIDQGKFKEEEFGLFSFVPFKKGLA